MRDSRTAVAMALLLLGSARAQEASELGLAFRGRLEWISAAQATAPRHTAVNPQNTVLRIPQASAQTELHRGPDRQPCQPEPRSMGRQPEREL